MRLHEAIALCKGEKGRNQSALTELHKANQKPGLFNGFSKTYRPVREDSPTYPPENQRVQLTVEQQIDQAKRSLTALFDTVATVEFGNTEATGSVLVNGETILRDVPVTYLLFLEKQVTDLRTFIEAIPTLSADDEWAKDGNSGLYRTKPTEVHRNRKVEKSLVLIEPTKEHPGQAKAITVDELEGYWTTTKLSGAMSSTRKAVLLARVEALLDGVKTARARANSGEVKEMKVGAEVLGFLFAD